MFVKICGISNAVDAALVNASQADAIGFVMGGAVFPVEVEPPAQLVRRIIKTLRSDLLSCLVTHLEAADEILSLAEYTGCQGLQISETIPVAEARKVRSRFAGRIIKTVVVEEHAFQRLEAYEPFADLILLDTRAAGYVGGTGRVSDWAIARELVKAARKPVILAGGLTPDNLPRAMAEVMPWGVDVSTGVSTFCSDYPRKDRKDPQRISGFIKLAKGL